MMMGFVVPALDRFISAQYIDGSQIACKFIYLGPNT